MTMDRGELRELVRRRHLPKDYEGWEIRTVGEQARYAGTDLAIDFVLFYKRPDRSMGHWQHFALCLPTAPDETNLRRILGVMEEENLTGGTLYLAAGVEIPSPLLGDLKEAGVRIRHVAPEVA